MKKQKPTAEDEKQVFYEKTQKGKDMLKVVRAIAWFRKKYPKRCSQALEFVGIYDDKAVMRILRKILKGSKWSLKRGWKRK